MAVKQHDPYQPKFYHASFHRPGAEAEQEFFTSGLLADAWLLQRTLRYITADSSDPRVRIQLMPHGGPPNYLAYEMNGLATDIAVELAERFYPMTLGVKYVEMLRALDVYDSLTRRAPVGESPDVSLRAAWRREIEQLSTRLSGLNPDCRPYAANRVMAADLAQHIRPDGRFHAVFALVYPPEHPDSPVSAEFVGEQRFDTARYAREWLILEAGAPCFSNIDPDIGPALYAQVIDTTRTSPQDVRYASLAFPDRLRDKLSNLPVFDGHFVTGIPEVDGERLSGLVDRYHGGTMSAAKDSSTSTPATSDLSVPRQRLLRREIEAMLAEPHLSDHVDATRSRLAAKDTAAQSPTSLLSGTPSASRPGSVVRRTPQQRRQPPPRSPGSGQRNPRGL